MGPNDQLDFDPIESMLKKQLSFRGLPYEGRPYAVDEDNKPTMARKVSTRQFNLTKKEHIAEYNEVFQRVADSKATISFEERIYDAELKSWRVLLRWFDFIYEAPKKKKETVL